MTGHKQALADNVMRASLETRVWVPAAGCLRADFFGVPCEMEKGVNLFLEVHLLYAREADFLKKLTKTQFAGRRDMKDAASKNGNTIAGQEDEIKRLKAKVCYVFFAVGGFAC